MVPEFTMSRQTWQQAAGARSWSIAFTTEEAKRAYRKQGKA